jgi:hypothetical protein
MEHEIYQYEGDPCPLCGAGILADFGEKEGDDPVLECDTCERVLTFDEITELKNSNSARSSD